MNWDSGMGDFLVFAIGTIVFCAITYVIAKLKGE